MGVMCRYLARMRFRIMRKPTNFTAKMTPPNEKYGSAPGLVDINL